MFPCLERVMAKANDQCLAMPTSEKFLCRAFFNSKQMKHFRLLFMVVFLLCSTRLYAQQKISGQVTDESGQAMVNATIKLKNGNTGILSDEDGNFQLEVRSLEDTIVVSFIGFEKKEIPLKGKNTVSVLLKRRDIRLDDVVVVGYGTQSRHRITTAIASVDSSVFEQVPVSNFQYALNGQLPGVLFTQRSGQPGGNTEILVRGVSSINAGNAPLIVIDGMIAGGSTGVSAGSNRTDPFLNLNPNDIASVEVLKDAAAASIYGSRGASGVIIITTKRGKFKQRPRVKLSYYGGISEPTNNYDLLNGQEYATLWNQAAEAVGIPQASGLYYDVESQPSTDWWDLITQRGYIQEYNASVSGGNAGTQYYLSGSYRDEEGYYKGVRLKRYSFRANIDQKIGNQVQVGLSINPSFSQNKRSFDNSFTSGFANALTWLPNVEAFDEKGNTISPPSSIGINFDGSPLITLLENRDRQANLYALLNAYVSYTPFSFLTLKTEFASEFGNSTNHGRVSSRVLTAVQQNGLGRAQSIQSINYNWTTLATFVPQLSGGHEVDLTLGTNFVEEERFTQFIVGNNFPNDQLLYLSSASNISFANSLGFNSTFAGYFSRLNYAFSNKYLLTLSTRIDGSSRFGEGERYGFFPAASAGWVLSEEGFFPNQILNFLKVRASWGISGNAAIGNLEGNSVVDFISYNGTPASVLFELENPELRWEKNEQWEIGLEFGIWHDRIQGNLSYYKKNGDGRDDDIVRGQNLFRTGERVDVWYLVPYAGVDPENGDALFLDGEGNTTTAYGQGARIIAGQSQPKFSGGLSHTLQYKGFELSAFFQFATGNQIYRADMGFLANGFSDVLNQFRSQLNAWTPENTNTNVPQVRLFRQNGSQQSTRFLDDGDYLRLKNLQFGYTFRNMGQWHGDVKIYSSMQNLLTFTKFGGLDPETRGWVSFQSPQARIISFGVQLGM